MRIVLHPSGSARCAIIIDNEGEPLYSMSIVSNDYDVAVDLDIFRVIGAKVSNGSIVLPCHGRSRTWKLRWYWGIGWVADREPLPVHVALSKSCKWVTIQGIFSTRERTLPEHIATNLIDMLESINEDAVASRLAVRNGRIDPDLLVAIMAAFMFYKYELWMVLNVLHDGELSNVGVYDVYPPLTAQLSIPYRCSTRTRYAVKRFDARIVLNIPCTRGRTPAVCRVTVRWLKAELAVDAITDKIEDVQKQMLRALGVSTLWLHPVHYMQ